MKELKLKESTVNKIKQALAGEFVHLRRTTPNNMTAHLEAIVDGAVETTLQMVRQNNNIGDENIKARAKSVLLSANRSDGMAIYQAYCEAYYVFQNIKDIKRHESRADYSDRIRYLVFRFLTAASIAAVVLVTGWVAKELGIPLPLLRPL